MERVTRGAYVWTIARAAMAVVIAAAIIAQAVRTIGGAASAGRDVGLAVTNFFSFFTILSNVGAVVVLTWAAVWFWVAVRRARRGRADAVTEPFPLAVALASVTTYMIVTGIVYNLLLRGVELPQGATVPWSNEVLHLVGPAFFVVDLFAGPARRALSASAILWVAVFPVVWIIYTLVRGPLVDDTTTGNPYWYPYPFLDPNGPGGYGSVFAYVVAIAVGLLVFAAAVVLVGRRRGLPARSERGARRTG